MEENLEYPEETEGSKMAAKLRAVCNKLTNEERMKLLEIVWKYFPELKNSQKTP